MGFEPSKVFIIAGKQDIYQFEIKHPKFEPLIKPSCGLWWFV